MGAVIAAVARAGHPQSSVEELALEEPNGSS